MKGYGITSSLLEWFKSFLSDLRQRVFFGRFWIWLWWGFEWCTAGVSSGSIVVYIVYKWSASFGWMWMQIVYRCKLISVVRNSLEDIEMQNNIDSVTNWTKCEKM